MADTGYRIEHDSLGEIRVPADALYGAHTQRAVENFPVSGIPLPASFLKGLVLLKAACAKANSRCGILESDTSEAIEGCSLRIAGGEFMDHFPVDVFQTGSGTSTNMNTNEIIARLASDLLGRRVHPNDHVNMSHSSNDIIPSAIHVSSCMEISEKLFPAMDLLIREIEKKGEENTSVVKTGRTHLMDATPITVKQELDSWASCITSGKKRIAESLERLLLLPIGGSATGTGINVPENFGKHVTEYLTEKTGLPFRQMENLFEGISAIDSAVEFSGKLKTLSVSLMKISNDLRWMNSGPSSGLGEISLPPMQPGSSIMPGKINPVIPEAVAMVCAQVMGNDTTVMIAGQSGNFQLNLMLPVTAYNILQSLHLLAQGMTILAEKAIGGLTVQRERISLSLNSAPLLMLRWKRPGWRGKNRKSFWTPLNLPVKKIKKIIDISET